jgi:hypothetical protein
MRLRASLAVIVVSALALLVVPAPALAAGPITASPISTGHWTDTVTVNPVGIDSELLGISCPTPGFCAAVGDEGYPGNGAWAEVWNGHWRDTPIPRPRDSRTFLTGVSCISAAFCVAVGASSRAGSIHSWAQIWNGQHWRNSATAPATRGSLFSGVSCPSSVFCLAVGASQVSTHNHRTLIEKWNGVRWMLLHTPAAAESENDAALSGVSCTSPLFCLAAGTFDDGTTSKIWNGVGWRTTFPPDAGAIYGVSCATSTFCAAVGSGDSDSPATWAATWNGTSWSQSPTQSDEFSVTADELDGVSCRSSHFCVAVGYQIGEDDASPIAEIWTGRHWTSSTIVVPSVAAGTQLASVSCPAVSFCTAAGSWSDGGRNHTLAERYH